MRYLIGLVVVAAFMGGCEVEKTEEGRLPEVSVEGGNLPKYDVDGPDVEIGSREVEVQVPNVDVNTETKTVTVPTVDVQGPNDPEDDDR